MPMHAAYLPPFALALALMAVQSPAAEADSAGTTTPGDSLVLELDEALKVLVENNADWTEDIYANLA